MSTPQSTPAGIIADSFAFLHNIPANFIDQVWNPDQYGWINAHLKTKYERFCRQEGYASPNAILLFFRELDHENTRRFCQAIADKILR